MWGLSPLGSVPSGGGTFTSPIWDTVGLWQLLPTPWQSCRHCPPSLPASQTLPHGPTHGAELAGLSPAKGRSGGLPLGVHSHLPVPQQGCRDWGSLWMQQGWGWAQPRCDPQGCSGHAPFSRSRSLPLALRSLFWFHLVSPARFLRLLPVGSIPCAHLCELPGTSRTEVPWAWLAGHGSAGSVLQAHLAEGVPGSVPRWWFPAASRGSPHQPGASRGPPLPAQRRLEIIKHIIYLAKLCARIRKRAGIRSPPGDRRQRVPPGFCFQCQHSAALKPWERSSLKWQLWSQAINLTS